MSLGDPTRRDILQRLLNGPLTVSDIAAEYSMSLPAISKHISYLERAKLVSRQKFGRTQQISLEMQSLQTAEKYLEEFVSQWNNRITQMKKFVETE